MRYVLMLFVVIVVVVFALTLASVAAAQSLPLRPVDEVARETLGHVLARSSVVRSLSSAIEASNLIVHIEASWVMPPGISGTTRFVTSRGGHRFARITINGALPLLERAALLGHELQHARELAESDAADTASVRRLFERTGRRSGDFFETRAAIDAERFVRRELRGELIPAGVVAAKD